MLLKAPPTHVRATPSLLPRSAKLPLGVHRHRAGHHVPRTFRCQATAASEAAVESKELAILKVDPQLADYKGHLNYRWDQYVQIKSAIEKVAGSVADFAKGYERMGFTREPGATVYREWAPGAQAAQLIGDFNNWQGSAMQKEEFGVWSVRIPDGPDGRPGIPHASRVKIRLQPHNSGAWVDRVPAWTRRAMAEPGKWGAHFDGIHWDPPQEQQYKWKHARPPRPSTPRIYEAHVGMSSEEPVVASYVHFRDNVLPRIAGLGYNTVQLMAVQEHVYYGSFGYHVTNPFAVSSRCGTPEELKSLVDEAHRLGLTVLLDLVHSHISKDVEDGLAGFDIGQGEEANYFLKGERGYHQLWDSRLFNYKQWEVLRYLLSNVRWWLEEYRFDGFRFDGVTSMLYQHHGINRGFSGSYNEYFGFDTNVDAVVYLMLANQLAHSLVPGATTIAEDVSGMPGLCRPVEEGGVGFDYRLGMGIPDMWIRIIKHVRDEDWDVHGIIATLCNRRYTEKTIAYAESHDQAMVGDQTIAWRLMGANMYTGMSALGEADPVVERGIALHKMIRLLVQCLGGDGWLGFMGNEFGHPEWIDFPREGNKWSHHYARRQWGLVDMDHLRYKFLNAWDRACMQLDQEHNFIGAQHQLVSWAGKDQVIVAERGPLLFVFNFNPDKDYTDYKVGVPEPGKWRVALDSDAFDFGGKGRVWWDIDHFTQPEGIPGVPETNYNNRPQSMLLAAPSRTVVVYKRIPDDAPAPPAPKEEAVGAFPPGWPVPPTPPNTPTGSE